MRVRKGKRKRKKKLQKMNMGRIVCKREKKKKKSIVSFFFVSCLLNLMKVSEKVWKGLVEKREWGVGDYFVEGDRIVRRKNKGLVLVGEKGNGPREREMYIV